MLGKGIYILSEVARLTELHPNRVRSWFKGRTDRHGRGPVFESDYKIVDGDFAVSFFDLIDVLIAGQFRDRHNVPMRIVRRAHQVLQEELQTKHPFCHSDLWTDGKRIFVDVANKIDEERLRDVVSQQQFFLHIKEKLDHIDYSEINKLALRWRITEGVVVDPSISMGKPTIENTGITTYVIYNQYYANNKNSDLVADLYGLSERDIANAVNFEKLYGRRVAA
ncbi:MAG: DUF433 domain-containing protein [Sedimentisphaerales bacterium]|nr:DUF433 domain-containing protein [Sedimentisphaerales bacterium]